MKRLLMTAFCLVCFSILAFGQKETEGVFYFNFIEGKLDDSKINEQYLPDHPFGKEIAKKMQLLKEAYTWKEEGSAAMPVERTIVEKPMIYDAIKKLSSYYKKASKKGEMTEDEAKAQLISAIDVALFIRYQQTAEFETKIRELKETEEIATLFTQKVKIQY